jgi:hypothetical protein
VTVAELVSDGLEEGDNHGQPAVVTGPLRVIPRDDRAWPRGAFVASAVLGLAAITAGVALVIGALDRDVLAALGVFVGFVAMLVLAVVTFLAWSRPWLRGEPVPGWRRSWQRWEPLWPSCS